MCWGVFATIIDARQAKASEKTSVRVLAGSEEAQLADPEQAVEFVERTGVDIFAPAIGTSHGLYSTKQPRIDFERLAAINRLLNGTGVKTPLVVHGATGLPQDYIPRLIESGGAKFNVSTELRRTLVDAQYEYITAHRQEYDPHKIDIAVRDAIRKAVGRWIEVLGSGMVHPRVLANCGTALTLDALARDGTHLGGLICASPLLMQDALTGATARLKPPRAAFSAAYSPRTERCERHLPVLVPAALVPGDCPRRSLETVPPFRFGRFRGKAERSAQN